jgi:hypothetical protein
MTLLRSDMKNKIKECALEALEQYQMDVRGDYLDISTGYASSSSTEDKDTTGFTKTFSIFFYGLASAKRDSVQNEGMEEMSPCISSKKEEEVLFIAALKN